MATHPLSLQRFLFRLRMRKPWINNRSVAIKIMLWEAWTPSPAKNAQSIHIGGIHFNNEEHEAMLYGRKPWVWKKGGFRKRTHPEDYA